MTTEFLINVSDKTMIKNLQDKTYKLYDKRQDVKDRVDEIVGSSNIEGMSRLKSDKDAQVSRIVKFKTSDSLIIFENEATTKYTDIMSELNNKRIMDTYCKIEELIETGEFNVINLLVDEYQSNMDDSSFGIIENAIIYHLTKSKYGTIDSRDMKNLSMLIDKFLSVYGLSNAQPGVKNHGIILGNDNKAVVSNEENVKSMIDRKVGNYGRRV